MKLAKTYRHLKKDLNIIEKALGKAIHSNHSVLRETSTQLLKAGGKRIRPVFVLLSGQFGHYDINKIKTVAVSLELIHMATLVHDDVVDEAELRRGEPTVMKLHGNRIAMYTGDYILARALENITTLVNPKIHKLLSKTLVDVCVGEIEQIKYKYFWNQHLRDYLRRIKRKTALLIATSCKLGALATGLNEKDANYLYQYGYNIGMSYQIIDDILDITSTPKELGKPTGNDLMQGNITLPVLYAMQDEQFYNLLKDTISYNNHVYEQDMEHLLGALRETDAIEKSYALSDRYINRALNALNELPNDEAKRSLQHIAHYIRKRKT